MAFGLRSQSDLRIGEWQSFPAYSSGISVTQDADNVYYASTNGLFSVRKADRFLEFFSKVDGLSDVGIKFIKYQAARDVLVVIYENSNIDLVYNDRIINIRDILTNNQIVGSKGINDVYTSGSTPLIYLSCDFGLVEFNLETAKFGFTLFTGTRVTSYEEFQDDLYISTDEGIRKFTAGGNELVSNFGAWDLLGGDAGLPVEAPAQGVIQYNNRLYAAVDNGLYRFEDDMFVLWDEREGHYLRFLSADGAHLKVGFRCFEDACLSKVHFYDDNGKVGEQGFACAGRTTYAIEDESGAVWYADEFRGAKVAGNYQWGCEKLEYNVPWSNNVHEIAIRDGVVYVASGGVSDTYNNRKYPDGFYIYEDQTWSFFNRTVVPVLGEKDVLDYLKILPHPDSAFIYVGSYYAGLIKYHPQDSSYMFYDQDNSLLQGAVGDNLRERVAGLALDDNGTLWMSCHLAPRPIVAMTADGDWANFAVPSGTRLGDVVVDRRGYKWFAIISAAEGLLVFDDNGTLDDTSDDRFAQINTSNSNLPTNLLNNLALDRDGDIWVGTDEGPVVFNASADPFSGESLGFRIKVDQGGVIAFLLGDEMITSIAVDGANRKWFGTLNGIFVQSPNGEEQIAHFNTQNSPLPNNIIKDIAINPENGDVFIGTESGIISLRTDAIAGGAFHSSGAYAFPNPVRPDFEGPVAIRGLAEDAAVKITDVSGAVVFETRALGGQAIWNGRDLNGQEVSSGVYLVFSTTESQFATPDALVTKVLFVR